MTQDHKRLGWANLLLLLVLSASAGCTGWGSPQRSVANYDLTVRLLTLLQAGQGGVLHLPVEVGETGVGAPVGANRVWQRAQQRTGRQTWLAGQPLQESQVFADPLVLVAVDAYEGEDLFAIPSGRPGQVLFRLGITQVVVHRRLFGEESMAVLDPVLRMNLLAPQRDLVDEVDTYPLRPVAPLPVQAVGLVRADESDRGERVGWRTLEESVADWR